MYVFRKAEACISHTSQPHMIRVGNNFCNFTVIQLKVTI